MKQHRIEQNRKGQDKIDKGWTKKLITKIVEDGHRINN